MNKHENNEKPVDFPSIIKKFVTDLWALDENGKFPEEAKFASRVVFSPTSITIDAVALRDLAIDLYEDRIEVPWMEPPVKMFAADPQVFDMTIALIAHLMLACSMGWDSTTKTGEYTQKRINELVNDRRRNSGKIPSKKV